MISWCSILLMLHNIFNHFLYRLFLTFWYYKQCCHEQPIHILACFSIVCVFQQSKFLIKMLLCCARLCCAKLFQSCLTLPPLWTIAHQAPLSLGFSRQEYWSGLPSPSPGDLPNPGIEPASLMSPALEGGLFATSTTWEDHNTRHSVTK